MVIKIRNISKLGKISKKDFLTILIFILTFVSNDTYLFGTNSVSIMLEIPRVLLAIYIIYELFYFYRHKKARPNSQTVLIALLMATIFTLVSLYHGDVIKIIVIKNLCIFAGLLFTQHYDFESYREAFIKVMIFNTIMALLLEIGAYILPSFIYSLPRIINTAGNEITTIGFAGILTHLLDEMFIRNSGIFWEPGTFQMYLNLAIIFELFNNKTIRWRNVIILSLGVFITFSTAGFIVLGWSMLTYTLLEKKETISRNSIIILGVLLVFIVVSLCVFDLSLIEQYVFGKLSNEESGSTIARSASVFVNLDIFFDYPMFGIGMKNITEELIVRSFEMYGKATEHNTNTLFYQFAAHGGFYGSLFLTGTCLFAKNLGKSFWIRVAITIAVMLIYVGENLRYSILPFILIFYGFNCARKTKR